jgi:transposase
MISSFIAYGDTHRSSDSQRGCRSYYVACPGLLPTGSQRGGRSFRGLQVGFRVRSGTPSGSGGGWPGTGTLRSLIVPAALLVWWHGLLALERLIDGCFGLTIRGGLRVDCRYFSGSSVSEVANRWLVHRRTAQKWITCFQQGKERLGGGARNGLGGYRNRKLKQEHYAFVYNLLQTRQDLYYDEYIDLLKAEFPGLRVDTSTLCRAFQRWGITRKAVRAVFLVPYAPVCRWQRATAARACTTLHLLVYMHPTYFVRARSTMFVAWSPPTAP